MLFFLRIYKIVCINLLSFLTFFSIKRSVLFCLFDVFLFCVFCCLLFLIFLCLSVSDFLLIFEFFLIIPFFFLFFKNKNVWVLKQLILFCMVLSFIFSLLFLFYVNMNIRNQNSSLCFIWHGYELIENNCHILSKKFDMKESFFQKETNLYKLMYNTFMLFYYEMLDIKLLPRVPADSWFICIFEEIIDFFYFCGIKLQNMFFDFYDYWIYILFEPKVVTKFIYLFELSSDLSISDSVALFEKTFYLFKHLDQNILVCSANYIFFLTNIQSLYFFYFDGVSLFFVLLTTFLFPICIIVSWYSVHEKFSLFLISLVSLEFFLVNAFLVSNLFYFFIFFEAILLPMFFIIGLWGSRDRKIHAVFQFLIYTLIGSLFLYVALFYILLEYDTLDYLILKNIKFTFVDQCFLFLLLFISFSFKIPLFPLHIWLPEAHVEAPTVGSVILAGLLLKLGTYGILRFVIPFFPEAVIYYTPLVYVIIILGIFYTSLVTIRQLDLKKIIAYSSIGHMGFVILGLFTTHSAGFAGSLFLMIGHGIVSSALFICVGLLYDRYHTRNITDLRGLAFFMPMFAFFFFFFTMANVSFPFTINFVAELNIIIAIGQMNFLAAIICVFSIVFILIYAFWLFNRIMFGNSLFVFDKFGIIGRYMDLSQREFIILSIFLFLTLFFGIWPNYLLDYFMPYCNYLNITYESLYK